MKPSYWGSIIYECAMGLYYSEDEAREQSWMGEHFFPLYSEESVKELQEAYTAEILLNGEMAERIKELQIDNENYEIKTEHLNDLVYELEQNLLAAQDQNHYFVLLGEYRDKNFELEKDNDNYEINTLKIMKERDELVSRLVSYEATIGYLKEALEDIADPKFVNCPREKARKCLGGLKK